MIDIDEFRTIQTKLREQSVKHFTYTPKKDRNKVYLLRGLDGHENPSILEEELKGLNINNVEIVKVIKFLTKQKENTLFMVQITAKSEEKHQLKTNKVMNTIGKWEKIKKREVIQCFRCQGIGHTSTNCGMDYKCVKCKANDHELGQCQLPKGVQHDAHTVYCASCQNYGHPASYRGCPKIKE